MPKLGEFAKSYETKTTRNIADLPQVSTDLELEDDEFEFTNATGEKVTVKQKVIEVNGEKYRVPISVVQQLRVHMEENPKMQRFRVKRTGSGKDDTRYTVIPLA